MTKLTLDYLHLHIPKREEDRVLDLHQNQEGHSENNRVLNNLELQIGEDKHQTKGSMAIQFLAKT